MTRLRRAALLAIAAAAAAAARVADAAPSRLLVLDERGRPLAGAEVVEARRVDSGLLVFDASSPPLASTGPDGILAGLPTPPSGGGLAVRAPGRAAALVPATDTPAAVVLWKASPTEGHLRTSTAGPAAGIEVRALPAEGVADLVHRTRSEENGRYVFAHLPPGRYRVIVKRPAGAWQDVGVVTAGRRAPGATLFRGAIVQGRVLDGDAARPVASLDLRLRPLAIGGVAVEEPVAGDPVALEGLSATTDPQGRFQLGDVTPGFYEPVLSDPTLAWDPAPPLVDVRATQLFRLETWWVLARVAVTGRAVDPEKKPVAGARVSLASLSSDAPPVGGFLSGASEVETGADGTFRVEGVFPGLYRLAVVAEGRAPAVEARVDVARRRGAAVGDLVLEPAWTLEVEVRSDAGPVEGARVVTVPADRPGPPDADPLSRALARSATTDAQGKVALPGQGRGPVRVRVEVAGFVPLEREVGDPRGAGSRLARLRLVAAAEIAGRVEGSPGAPSAASVRGTNRRTGAGVRVEPEPDGTFRLRDLLPEPTDVEAVSETGLVLARAEAVTPGGTPVVLRTAEGRALSGTVEGLEADGPAGTVRLEAPARDAVRDTTVWRVVGDRALPAGASQATFSFETVPAGSYALRAVQGVRDVRVEMAVGGEDRAETTLRLPEGATLDGEVRDAATERPRAGVRVRAARLQGDGLAPAGAATPTDRLTGSDGTYVFEGLAPGLWRISASDRDSPEVWKDVRVLGSKSSEAPDLFLSSGGRVGGTLETGRGRRRLAGVPVRLRRLPDLEEAASTTTLEDGTFLTPAVPPGRYRLRALDGAGDATLEDAPFLEADVEVVAGQTTQVALGALGRGRIEGTVFRGANRVGGVRLSAALADPRGGGELVVRARTDEGGAFAWEGLPAGKYRLRVEEDAVERVQEVVLEDGDRAIVRLELADGRIEGTVRRTDGSPVSGAEVVAVPIGGGADAAVGRARSAGDGSFAVEGLPIGSYRLVVAPPSLPPRSIEPVTADLRGSGVPADVVVGGGATLEVVATDAGGRPVSAAAVWVDSPEAVALHRRPWFTGPDGMARIEGLAPGLARVRVHARGLGRPAPRLLELRAGTVDRVEAALQEGGAVRLLVVAGGAPVAGARVEVLLGEQPVERRRSLFPEDEGAAWGRTDASGTLVLEDLEEETYTLRVRAPGGATGSTGTEVRAGRTVDATAVLDASAR